MYIARNVNGSKDLNFGLFQNCMDFKIIFNLPGMDKPAIYKKTTAYL